MHSLPPGVSLRRAHPTDAPALKRFKCRNPGEKWTRAVQQDIRRDLPGIVEDPDTEFEVIVAIAGDGGLVGVIAFSLGEDGRMHISALAVTHTWRRQKIGTALKQAVIDNAAARGVGIVWSDVHKLNRPMLELNRSLEVALERDPEDSEFMLCIAYVEAADDPEHT